MGQVVRLFDHRYGESARAEKARWNEEVWATERLLRENQRYRRVIERKRRRARTSHLAKPSYGW